jgi:ribosomal protein S24E
VEVWAVSVSFSAVKVVITANSTWSKVWAAAPRALKVIGTVSTSFGRGQFSGRFHIFHSPVDVFEKEYYVI